MKLLRIGSNGNEKPAALDKDGKKVFKLDSKMDLMIAEAIYLLPSVFMKIKTTHRVGLW